MLSTNCFAFLLFPIATSPAGAPNFQLPSTPYDSSKPPTQKTAENLVALRMLTRLATSFIRSINILKRIPRLQTA